MFSIHFITIVFFLLILGLFHSLSQFSLGKTSKAPCLVLQFKGASIKLDCSLDVSTLQHFMPLSLVKKWVYRFWGTYNYKQNFNKKKCMVFSKSEGVRVNFFPYNIYVNSERTSQLKPRTTRELQDIEGFSSQNVSCLWYDFIPYFP